LGFGGGLRRLWRLFRRLLVLAERRSDLVLLLTLLGRHGRTWQGLTANHGARCVQSLLRYYLPRNAPLWHLTQLVLAPAEATELEADSNNLFPKPLANRADNLIPPKG
jgi:hypothetical protein